MKLYIIDFKFGSSTLSAYIYATDAKHAKAQMKALQTAKTEVIGELVEAGDVELSQLIISNHVTIN